MKRRHSLSAIIIAFNEADRIRACLESVKDLADEIVVFDSGSTDETVSICREYTDRVFVTDWPGDGVQKQRALEEATCEWVFRIDADERISPELRDEVAAILDQDTIDEVAFRVPWATYFFGRYVVHGEGGICNWNLYRREGARYEAAVVHAKFKHPPGSTRTLKGRLYHDANRDMHHMLGKLTDYACYSARQSASRGRKSGILRPYLRAFWRFIHVYFYRRGFLDGRRGLLMATIYSHYAFNKYAALWAEGQRSLPPSEDRLPRAVDGERTSVEGEPPIEFPRPTEAPLAPEQEIGQSASSRLGEG